MARRCSIWRRSASSRPCAAVGSLALLLRASAPLRLSTSRKSPKRCPGCGPQGRRRARLPANDGVRLSFCSALCAWLLVCLVRGLCSAAGERNSKNYRQQVSCRSHRASYGPQAGVAQATTYSSGLGAYGHLWQGARPSHSAHLRLRSKSKGFAVIYLVLLDAGRQHDTSKFFERHRWRSGALDVSRGLLGDTNSRAGSGRPTWRADPNISLLEPTFSCRRDRPSQSD